MDLYEQRSNSMIVFDNLDFIERPDIRADFIESVLSIARKTNRQSDVRSAARARHQPMRFGFTIRSSNFPRRYRTGGGADRIFVLGLGSVTNSSIPRYYEIRTSREFFSEVIRLRIEKLRISVSESLGDQLVTNVLNAFYEDDSLSTIKDSVFDIEIYKLNNNSVRLILLLMSQIIVDVLHRAIDGRVPLRALDPGNQSALAYKGLILRSLKSDRFSADVIKALHNGIAVELESGVCCPIRMALIYIMNKKTSTFRDMASEFHSVLEIPPEKLREVLWTLYANPSVKDELVTISQDYAIHEASKIADEAEVAITDRGVVFLDKVIIHLDYFGQALTEDSPVLAELTPGRAVEYISTILVAVRKIAQNHVRYWRDDIQPRIARSGVHTGTRTTPTEYYMKWFSYGNEFYMTRCADSHRYSIKRYIQECLRGESHRLMISEEETPGIVSLVDRAVGSGREIAFTDADITGVIHQLSEENSLRQMWDLYSEYGSVIEQLRAIHR